MKRNVISHFVSVSDKNYTLQVYMTLASLIWACRHNVRPIVLDVLDVGIGDDKWKELVHGWTGLAARINHGDGSWVTIDRHVLKESDFDGLGSWHGSVATYARMKLPTLIPDEDWILYADSDVLFVKDPVELEECCDERYAILGHKDPGDNDLKDYEWHLAHNLPWDRATSICGGFMLLNMRWFREHDVQRRSFDFLRQYEGVIAADQSALHTICFGHVGLLPFGWGVFNNQLFKDEEIGAIHYVHQNPWRPPVNWLYFWNNYMSNKLWYSFADRVLGIKGIEAKYRALRLTWKDRLRAFVTKWYIVITKMLGCMPQRYAGYNQYLCEAKNTAQVKLALNRLIEVE